MPANGTAGVHYFFDTTIGAFWPEAFPNGQQPAALFRWDQLSGAGTEFLFGSYDGYLRKIDASAADDDGMTITSYVGYGPLRPGAVGYEAQLTMVAVDLDESSQIVALGAFTADIAQGVLDGFVAGTPNAGPYLLNAGRNTSIYPGIRGVGMGFVLQGAIPWAVEGMRIQVRQGGVLR